MAREPIIDCDVHHMIAEPEELFPYLPRDYVEHIQDFGLMLPGGFSTGYTNMPKGGARADVWDGDIHPANNIDMARKRHLDEYGRGGRRPDRIDGVRSVSTSQCGLRGRPLPRLQRLDSGYLGRGGPPFFWFHIGFGGGPVPGSPGDPPFGQAHPRMVQVIVPAGARMPFGNRFYHPMYEAAQEYGLPVCIHFGAEGAGVSGPPTGVGYPSYYLEMRMARPQNAMAHVSSLICEGVFEKFPNLRFLFVEHDTFWVPGLMWHMDADWKSTREYTPWVKRPPQRVHPPQHPIRVPAHGTASQPGGPEGLSPLAARRRDPGLRQRLSALGLGQPGPGAARRVSAVATAGLLRQRPRALR